MTDHAKELARQIIYESNASMVDQNREWFCVAIAGAIRFYSNEKLEELCRRLPSGNHCDPETVAVVARALKSYPDGLIAPLSSGVA